MLSEQGPAILCAKTGFARLTRAGADLFDDGAAFVVAAAVAGPAVVGADVNVGSDEVVISDKSGRFSIRAGQIEWCVGLCDRRGKGQRGCMRRFVVSVGGNARLRCRGGLVGAL